METIPYFLSVMTREFEARCDANSRYSMRAFAKALMLSPAAVSQFLSGKQSPSYRVALNIMERLNLAPEERHLFLSSLAEVQRSRDLKRMNPALRHLSDFGKLLGAPVDVPQDLSLDVFRLISEWYHYAILFLTFVEGFKPDPKWIAGQLNIEETEVRLALQRLLKLEMLKKKNGTYVCWQKNFTTADTHLTGPALRKHQKQVLQKAIFSLENDPIEERNMTCMTMAIDPEKLPEAKKLISTFNLKMSRFLESGSQKRVYNLSIALYPVQKRRSSI